MDNVLRTEMKCGCFQVTFAFLTQLARFSTVWGLYIMMFGNYEPPWRCASGQGDGQADDTNSSYYSSLTLTRGGSPADANASALFNETSYSSSCKILPSCRRVEFQSDSSTIVTEFGLICDKAWIASFIISIELLAVVPGAYIGGQVGERFGRKVSLYGSTALLSASTGLAIFSLNWQMYTVISFFIGLGGGGILSTAVVYTMEFLSPWWRAMFASVPVWNASLALFTFVIVVLRDWKLIHLTSACLSGLTFLGVFWVPESVRWLEVHGKRQEAIRVVKRIYRTNKLDLSHVNDACQEATQAIESKDQKDITTSKSTSSSSNSNNNHHHKTYLDLFRDPYIRSITLKASTAWLCTLIAYLAMGYGVKSLAGDYYVNIIIASVSEIPMMLLIGPVSNHIGRRWSAMSFLCGAAAACGAIVLVQLAVEEDGKGFAIKILALVAKACAAAAWCALSTLSVELFPTVVRNLGYGFLTLVSRSGGIIAPYLIPQDPNMFAVCFSVMTGALFLSIFMALSLPETKDRPLTDVIVQEPDAKSQGEAADV